MLGELNVRTIHPGMENVSEELGIYRSTGCPKRDSLT